MSRRTLSFGLAAAICLGVICLGLTPGPASAQSLAGEGFGVELKDPVGPDVGLGTLAEGRRSGLFGDSGIDRPQTFGPGIGLLDRAGRHIAPPIIPDSNTRIVPPLEPGVALRPEDILQMDEDPLGLKEEGIGLDLEGIGFDNRLVRPEQRVLVEDGVESGVGRDVGRQVGMVRPLLGRDDLVFGDRDPLGGDRLERLGAEREELPAAAPGAPPLRLGDSLDPQLGEVRGGACIGLTAEECRELVPQAGIGLREECIGLLREDCFTFPEPADAVETGPSRE